MRAPQQNLLLREGEDVDAVPDLSRKVQEARHRDQGGGGVKREDLEAFATGVMISTSECRVHLMVESVGRSGISCSENQGESVRSGLLRPQPNVSRQQQ